MEWLNYHHLLYFYIVAREGTIARAGTELRLAKPTISGQIRQLESALDEKLFTRRGRRLVLTEIGRVVFRYAEEIFSVGRELLEAIKRGAGSKPLRLIVGVDDVLPKLIVRRLLQPAFQLDQPVRIICREDRTVEEFIGELAAHALDLVLTDAPVGPGIRIHAFSHLLGECGTTFFAAPRLAAARREFPRSLDGAALLLPGAASMLRRALEQWFLSQGVRPAVVAEFDDPALMNVFGEDGAGIFCGPTVIEQDYRRMYGVKIIGRVRAIRQRFYAISVERRLTHTAVAAITQAARQELFMTQRH
jgi:LysR family transcriptional activator of nhaA